MEGKKEEEEDEEDEEEEEEEVVVMGSGATGWRVQLPARAP